VLVDHIEKAIGEPMLFWLTLPLDREASRNHQTRRFKLRPRALRSPGEGPAETAL